MLVFIGLAKAVATMFLAQGPKAHYIQHADRWGRALYPLALLANAALAFLVKVERSTRRRGIQA